MTTIDVPSVNASTISTGRVARPVAFRARGLRRTTAAALRGAGAVTAVVAHTIPAHFTLHSDPSASGVIAAATAYGAAAILSVVLAASIWRLLRARALTSALTGSLALLVASALQLYASLTLIWQGDQALAQVDVLLATAQMLLGVHLVAAAAGAIRLRSTPLVPAGLGLSGLAVLAAVFPPTWYPQTSDALLPMAVGQLTFVIWFLTHWTPTQR